MNSRLGASVSYWRVALWLASGMFAVAIPAVAQRAPTPDPIDLPPEVLALACAPTLAFEEPPTPLRVTGSQHASIHKNFAPGELITVNGGTDNGIEVGQMYYIRRAVPREKRAISRDNPAVIQTSGWLRIYATDRTMSLATIAYPCDAVHLHDYLEPFTLPTITSVSADRPPAQRGNYARIMVGNDNRRSFGKGDYFVVDRGSDHGVTRGAQFVVYRDHLTPGNFLYELGEAVAIDVRPESSTLQGTLSRDGFRVGDYVALRKSQR
jgi:hypothetical protein